MRVHKARWKELQPGELSFSSWKRPKFAYSSYNGVKRGLKIGRNEILII